MKYRIREAKVEVCNGYRRWHERRFIAERRIMLFGVALWWFPVIDADWRASEQQAKSDLEHDVRLRKPLAAPKVYQVH